MCYNYILKFRNTKLHLLQVYQGATQVLENDQAGSIVFILLLQHSMS